ncbi:MAG TPA: hypothetical protein VG676_09635 [Chitinophagaceae bacterium]|nr:hypothetical protein [Chitinophagaceae bacterium]
MNKKRIILLILLIILLFPLWMWIAWLLTPKKKLVVAIIDKTAMTKDGQEHVSFTWILNHNRYTKNKSMLYTAGNDYYGFFPKENENFRIKGLERFSATQLEKLSTDADMAYYTDTYGIYRNEWYLKKNVEERSGVVYGGMSEQDIDFLRNMKAKHKLIIAEFNTIGSPTSPDIKNEFENMFALKWTGWTGKYFSSLDTAVNTELPRWLINNYKREHEGQWPFHNAGIAFVNNTDYVVVVEEKTHLNDALPHIICNNYGKQTFGLPESMKYSYWFDIMQPDTTVNKIVAEYSINVNDAGKEELMKNNIPYRFPAITMHRGADYQFYYFSGDFCDNKVNILTSYFKGIRLFKSFFYNSKSSAERASFFWNYYQPLMTAIVNDYYDHLPGN